MKWLTFAALLATAPLQVQMVQAQTANGGASQTSSLLSMLPLVLIFVVFYFMLIRPQNKRAKEHREMIAAMETGAEVATAGGIVGKVTEVGESIVTVEIAPGVNVKVQRNTIAQILPKGTIKNS